MKNRISGLQILPRKIIRDDRGAVYHMLRSDEPFWNGKFGEIYFSAIKEGIVKAWKRHLSTEQRFVVPVGRVRFVFVDERPGSETQGGRLEVECGPDNYHLLLVPPGLWYGFEGKAVGESLIVNCASLTHASAQIETLDPKEASFRF